MIENRNYENNKWRHIVADGCTYCMRNIFQTTDITVIDMDEDEVETDIPTFVIWLDTVNNNNRTKGEIINNISFMKTAEKMSYEIIKIIPNSSVTIKYGN